MSSISIPQIFGVKKREQKSIAAIKSQVQAKRKGSVQPFWLYAGYSLIAINVVLLFSYLLGVNAQTASGYEIQKIQQKIQTLTDTNKQLNLKVSEQASIAQIQSDFLNNGYVSDGQPRFLIIDNYAINK